MSEFDGTWQLRCLRLGTPEGKSKSQEWCRKTHALMAPFQSGAYQPIGDQTGVNAEVAFFGENTARLAKLKAKYDPENVFCYSPSVLEV